MNDQDYSKANNDYKILIHSTPNLPFRSLSSFMVREVVLKPILPFIRSLPLIRTTVQVLRAKIGFRINKPLYCITFPKLMRAWVGWRCDVTTSNSIQDGGALVVNILVFDLRVQLPSIARIKENHYFLLNQG